MTVHSRDALGRKLLYDLSQGNMREAFNLLAQGAWLNVANGSGAVALHVAASMGETEMVAAIIDQGADVNRRDKAGSTALMYAAENGHAATVETLLRSGADFASRNNTEQSALDLAKAGNHFLVASILGDALSAQRQKTEEEWKYVPVEAGRDITVSKPIQFKLGPKSQFVFIR
jgi:ankyrin repeat protein